MRLKKMTCILLGILLAVSLSAGKIVQEDGNAYREIIIAPDAPSTVRLAAEELRKYIEAVCGTKLPVINNGIGTGAVPCIYVGASPGLKKNNIDLAGLKPEGFKIVAKPGLLAIAGRDYSGPIIFGFLHPWRKCDIWNAKLQLDAFGENGTLSGVYAFLEKYCGVRWYMPGELGTVINPQTTITIPPFTWTDAPAVKYRYPLFCLFGEEFGQETDGPLWFKRMRFGGARIAQIMHSYKMFLKYKDTHPEYFALVDGQRDFGSRCALSGGGHLCLTNPDVIAQWADDICEYFDKHPEEECFPLVPMDGLTRICGCPRCQAEIDHKTSENGKFSNHIWGFVNKVAAKVAKKYPDKYVTCLAYDNYFNPPTAIDKLHPNVAVMLCYHRSALVIPDIKKKIHEEMKIWDKMGVRIYVWNWYLDTWRPWRGLPVIYTQAISDDIKFSHKLNYGGNFIQAENNDDEGTPFKMRHPGMQHLNLYVTGKLLWNPDQDIKPLLDEYFRLFYGPAESEMRNFWMTAEKARIKAGIKVNGKGRELVPEDVFTPVVLKIMDESLRQALAKTSPDSVYYKRIKLIAEEFASGRRSLVQLLKKGKQTADVYGPVAQENVGNAVPLRFITKDGEATMESTWLYLGWDARNLYLKFICYEPEMRKLKAIGKYRDMDNVIADDNIEIFISPNLKNPEQSFQFAVNARGVIWDARYGFGGIMDKSWNAKIKTAVKFERNRWILNVKIPFSELGINSASSEMALGANFYRSRVCDKKSTTYSCWSPVFEARHYSPHRFGTIILKNRK